MDNEFLKDFLSKELGLQPEQVKEEADLRIIMAKKINDCLNSDFQKVVSILYRVDVDENKLRTILRENPDKDAGLIITDLIIERQIAKIKSRRETPQRDKNISDEESW